MDIYSNERNAYIFIDPTVIDYSHIGGKVIITLPDDEAIAMAKRINTYYGTEAPV